jgi:hypothetical protein
MPQWRLDSDLPLSAAVQRSGRGDRGLWCHQAADAALLRVLATARAH